METLEEVPVRLLSLSACFLLSFAHLPVALRAQTQPLVSPGSVIEVSGRVLDPASLPVVGARVVIWTSPGLVRETITGADGDFSLDVPAAATAEVHVEYDGFQGAAVRFTPAAGAAPLEIRLSVTAVNESLTVTASQVDLPRALAPTHVTMLSGDDLRAQHAESLADALRLVPGFTVASTGGRGALTTMFARGGESDYALVLIDGVRVNNFGGLFDAAQLPVDAVDRVEVARGPQSALFGSDAIGGVVHVISRRDHVSRADAAIDGGSYGTLRATSAASVAHGHWRLGLSGERQTSDGFEGLSPTSGALVSNDDYTRTSGRLSLRHDTPRTALFGHTRFAQNDRGVPGPFGRDPGGTYGGVDTISRTLNRPRELAAGLTHSATPRLLLRAHASHARSRSSFASPFGESESRFSRTAARVSGDITVTNRVAATVGIEQSRERADSTFILGGNAAAIPVRRALTGVFSEARVTASDRLFFSAGMRVEHIRREALEADPLAFPPRPTLPEDRLWSFNPKLSASYALGPSTASAPVWRVKVNAGTGIRPPDAFEIAYTDNPSLKPERSISADLGLEHTWADGRMVTEGVAFVNRYDDLLVAVGRSFADASQFRTDNIANAETKGVELATTAAAGASLRVRASYTFLVSSVLAVDGASRQAPSPFDVGQPLIRRPRHNATAQATWAHRQLSVFSRVQLRGRTLDIDPSYGAFGGTFTNPGFAVMDLGASMRIGRQVSVSARALNLFDRRYEEVLGFPTLGRQFLVGVRVASHR